MSYNSYHMATSPIIARHGESDEAFARRMFEQEEGLAYGETRSQRTQVTTPLMRVS